MRPITIIVAALVAGAAARRKPAAKQAIKDAYARVKALIQDRYRIRALEALELTPHSKNKQASVAAELTDAGADKDEALLDQAKSLLNIVIKHDPSALNRTNINFDKPEGVYKQKDAAAKGDSTLEFMTSLSILSRGKNDRRAGKKIAGSVATGHRDDKKFAVIRVLYATDRDLIPNAKPTEVFGNGRGKLSLGYCDVSIPRDHRMGELESPSIWRFEIRADPARHVVLLDTVISSKDEFFEELAVRVRASAKSSAFVFVHGYNVTFENAARRTAQISYDLGFDGAPVFYSWPSQGSTPAYIVDEQNVEWAQANLRGFLEEFFVRSDAQNVYLIAHSMGNRALTRAVASLLADKPSLRGRLKEVILTAPDIDADVFKRDIVPALTASGCPVTLYASSQDLALAASKKAHGYARAGDSGRGLVVVAGVETVDATYVDTSFLGHSYFAENRSVLSDMYYLILNGERADFRFGLRPIDAQNGRYWEFKQ